jgi:hypothetical protein
MLNFKQAREEIREWAFDLEALRPNFAAGGSEFIDAAFILALRKLRAASAQYVRAWGDEYPDAK